MNTEFDTKNIDYAAIEHHARQLRAETARAGLARLRVWIAARLSGRDAAAGQNA
ncbi:MAG: hypothetical protein AAF982_01255 [Pseudomonadota bacterium]